MTQERWQKLTDWPLTIAAVIFLIAYAWEIIAGLDGRAATVCEIAIWITWGFFVIDYLANLLLADRRWHWFSRHIFDLLVVVLPMLRPLRLLRLVTLLSVLQRTAGTALRGKVIVYVVGAASLLVFVAALAVLDSERGSPHSSIASFSDALWWAFVTITTVGYGDFAPVSFEGRTIAVGLMLGGIALVGVVTGTLASWIVERVAKQEADTEAATQRQVKELSVQLARIEEALLSGRGT